jgi:uncharacterized membrane protein YdjX (TVP38/TMEM64 family)
VGVLVLLVGLGAWASAHYDLARVLDEEHVDRLVAEAGAWGVLVYLAVFIVGELLNIPGLVFVGAAVVAYGRGTGLGLAFVGAFLSATVGFFFARAIAGRPLTHGRSRPTRWVLHRLELHPVRMVAILRLIFWMAPLLTYVLGMTNIRYKAYALGTAIGLVPGVVAGVFFMDWIARTFL